MVALGEPDAVAGSLPNACYPTDHVKGACNGGGSTGCVAGGSGIDSIGKARDPALLPRPAKRRGGTARPRAGRASGFAGTPRCLVDGARVFAPRARIIAAGR